MLFMELIRFKLRAKYTFNEMNSIMRRIPKTPNTMGRIFMRLAMVCTMPS
jgi:hypothetical protein